MRRGRRVRALPTPALRARWQCGYAARTMFDPITLDQLRAFVAVVEEGSFSAAARKLSRVQSAVSTAMANLESQLGVAIWDRSTKIASLTEQGQAVLGATRRVLAEVDALHRLTTGMTMGLEAQVSLCVEAFFPLNALVELCARFTREFPAVDLRIDTQVMSAVSARVRSGGASLGVVSPAGLSRDLESIALAPVRMVAVASPAHPLATVRSPLATALFADAIQIVLSERSDDGVADQAVLSPRTWRVGDLHTKHEMLRAGLGWGNLPEHLVRGDLASGALVALRPAAWGDGEHTLHLSAIYRSQTVFGPAHRWMLSQLKVLCAREAEVPTSRPTKGPPARPARRT